MKAVIFAAGRGKRMLPLTKQVCKPMLRLHGKPILEHILETLPKNIDKVILIVGYKSGQIKKYFGNRFNNRKIRYILQKKPTGTWSALCLAKKYLSDEEKFLVLNADDLHGRESIRKLVKFKNAILVSRHNEPEKFGVVKFDSKNILQEIEEKPKKPQSNLVSVGVYVLSPSIFNCKKPEPINGELYLPRVLNQFLQIEKIKVLETDFWLPIGNPEEFVKAHDVI